MSEDLTLALQIGQRICWDETHGYVMGADMDPNTDCSGFVGYCLSQAGFNVPRRWDTTSMITTLRAYSGFTEYIWAPGFQWQNGDIAVYDEGGGTKGHTFFYCTNIYGYQDSYWGNASDSRKGILSAARMEAAGTHNHPQTGDQANQYGANTEVWIHAYSDPDSSHTWHVFRWQGGAQPPGPPDPPTPPPGPTPGPTPGNIPPWLLIKLIRNREYGG